MKIPKHLQRRDMSAAQKRHVLEFVKERRKLLSQAPTYGTVEEATSAAVKLAKKEKYSFPSVWKEPEDIGEKHAVVHTDYIEDAYNAGYTQEVEKQKIFDMANGREEDDIEEVD